MLAEPMGSDDHLARARFLLDRAIRARAADGMLGRTADGGYSSALGTQEIERLMRPSSQTDVIEDHNYDPASPIGDLVVRLGLGPTEADLLAVLLACETDPASARLAQYLASNSEKQFATTVDTLFEIAYRPRAGTLGQAATLLHNDLAADGFARRLRFLIVEGADSRPFLSQTVRLHPRITGWLLGRKNLDSELTAHARLGAPDRPIGTCDPQQLATLVRSLAEPRRLILLQGAQGSGRELLLRFAAHEIGRPLLLVGGRGLDADKVVAAFREATLQGAVLAFRDAEEAMAEQGRARFRECLEVYPHSVALAGLGDSAPAIVPLRATTEIQVVVPPHQEREKLWRTYLGETTLTDVQWKEIAGLYNLGIGGIVSASSTAAELARAEALPLGRTHISRAVRQLFDADLKTIAKRMEVSQTWDDVVLPDEVVDSLVGIVDRVAFRNEVLGEWGFGRKIGKAYGLTILFSGQPGTGKSMVAGLIARELGLDLYVIDLSRIMSKWLGETEKNLARAFDAAEAGHVLLLFDEADTVLGKRSTEMRGANDRHANLETNFILARLEQFHGIAVFTTNIASAVDPAVLRRMSANIVFPFPDVEARAELWRRMIPAEAPVAGKLDFVKLAKQYELSGGYIKNVVLRAAYSAAREGQPISMQHLERAAHGEYGDRGALTIGGRMS